MRRVSPLSKALADVSATRVKLRYHSPPPCYCANLSFEGRWSIRRQSGLRRRRCENGPCRSQGARASLLFISKRHHWIDTHGSPRGRVRRDQGDQRNQESYTHEGHAVDRVYPIERAAQQVRLSNRQAHSDKQARDHEPETFAQYRWRMSRFWAPIAIRIPTSRVRRTTMKLTVP